jgi:hypothetical protein
LGGRVVKVRWQLAGNWIAPPVREFGLENTRGTGTQKHADAARPIALARFGYGLDKTVLFQGELGETVVATVKPAEVRSHLYGFKASYLTDVGRDVHGFE